MVQGLSFGNPGASTNTKDSQEQPYQSTLYFITTLHMEEETIIDNGTPSSQDVSAGTVDTTLDTSEDTTTEAQYDWAGRKLSATELYEESQKLQKDYTQKTQRLSELEKREQEMQAMMSNQQKQEVDPLDQLTPQERYEYEEAAKKLSPFLQKQLESQVEEMVTARMQATNAEQERINHYKQEFDAVEKLAKDVGVTLNQAELVQYMKDSGTMNVKDAFKAKYFDQMVDYTVAQRKSKENKITTVTGGKTTPQGGTTDFTKVKLTDPSYKASLADTLRKMAGRG